MADRTPPTRGPRLVYQLPFGRVRRLGPNNDTIPLVRLKQETGEALGWEPVKNIPRTKVSPKKGPAKGKTYYVRRKGSYRRGSVKLLLENPLKIGKRSYLTLEVPKPYGVQLDDFIGYFQSKPTDAKVVGVVNDTGAATQWKGYGKNHPKFKK